MWAALTSVAGSVSAVHKRTISDITAAPSNPKPSPPITPATAIPRTPTQASNSDRSRQAAINVHVQHPSDDFGPNHSSAVRRARPDAEHALASGAQGGYRPRSASAASATSSEYARPYAHGVSYSEGAFAASRLDDDGARRRRRRRARKEPPEILVIVRPPPSKQNHPLNLQMQLVTPQPVRDRNRSSGEFTPSESGASVGTAHQGVDLKRTASVSSNRSGNSTGAASLASAYSGASTTSSGGTPRRVTPLYNLQFHNLLTTVVTDAGTDDKVAKFGRRGVEVIGLGLLEPAEMKDCRAHRQHQHQHQQQQQQQQQQGGRSPPSSVGACDEARSVSSNGHAPGSITGSQQHHQPPTSLNSMTSQARAVDIADSSSTSSSRFGDRLANKFKKLGLGVSGSRSSSSVSTAKPVSVSMTVTSSTTVKRADKADMASGSAGGGGGGGAGGATGGAGTLSPAAALGHANDIPQLIPGAGLADGRRTEGYVWHVRKWTRRTDTAGGILSASSAMTSFNGQPSPGLVSAFKRFSMQPDVAPPPAGDLDVKFEWTRGVSGRRQRRKGRNGDRERSRERDGDGDRERRALDAASTGSVSARPSVDAGPGPGSDPLTASASAVDPRRLSVLSSVTNASSLGEQMERLDDVVAYNDAQARQAAAMASADALAIRREASLASLRSHGGPGGPGSGSRPGSRPGSRAGSVDPRSPGRSSEGRKSVDSTALRSIAGAVDDREAWREEAEEEEEDSDPEDSETPWSCHLVLSPTTRIPLGTLSPAPHHPKLIGQLAIPFPLPDLSATGIGADGAGLTKEELKDIVSVTCLWLVVRESFGGLAKARKGDAVWKLHITR